MTIRTLTPAWEDTRATLQRFAHAVTAMPRAGAPADPRWSQVAMEVTDTGLTSAPTPLADGTELVSLIDLVNHRIVVSAGETRIEFDLGDGPTPRTVGDAIASVAADHGSDIDTDVSRYDDDTVGVYDRESAAEFFNVASSVVAAFDVINSDVPGEVVGPHLWPHGFDIATEWYSSTSVDADGTPANAQIAIGWYPAGEAYFYANPWPFDESWAEVGLPGGAEWNTEGWYGAKLPVSALSGESASETVVALGNAVHDTARASLSQ